MTARKSALSKPPPPPPARAAGTLAAGSPRRPSKPPVPELLADEFVEDDIDELPSEDLIVEDLRGESAVVFAGPSDPPPGPAIKPPSVTNSATRRPATTVSHARFPADIQRMITIGCGAVAGALAVAIAVRSRAPDRVRAEPPATAIPAVEPRDLPPRAPPHPPAALPPPPAATAPLPPALPEPVAATSVATAIGAPPLPDEAAASDTKHAAQKALEHGQVARAITFGEQSVQLDPTDAEGWLILGAAYLQKGAFKDAHRCFTSCVKQATHGARSECAALSR